MSLMEIIKQTEKELEELIKEIDKIKMRVIEKENRLKELKAKIPPMCCGVVLRNNKCSICGDKYDD